MKILLLSHGNFCHGIKESYTMIAGDSDDIISIELGDDGIGPFSVKVTEVLDEISKKSKVIVFTDIKGGTPYNVALKYQLGHPETIEIITGMNLPMLVEVGLGLNSGQDIKELAALAVKVGKESIEHSELLDNEDDDLEF